MVARVQAALVALVLVVGGVRVLTYDAPPPPAPLAADVWRALLVARSARVTLTDPPYVARGVLEPAGGRTLLRVDAGPHAPYAEVTDRSVVYVRPATGRWYRYLDPTGASSVARRALALVTRLSSAGSLSYAGRESVRDVPTVRFRGADVEVWVDADGLPRRVRAAGATIDLSDFLGPAAVRVPAVSTGVAGLDAAFGAAP